MFPVTVALVAVAMLAGIDGGMHPVLRSLISINLWQQVKASSRIMRSD